jgi:hypothetical protein
MTHSPLPWTWQTSNAGPEDQYGCNTYGPIDPLTFKSTGYCWNPELMDANGEPVLSAGSGEYTPYLNAADAVFIAKACNLHAELIGLIQKVIDANVEVMLPAPSMAWIAAAQAALKKAKQ